MIDSESEIEHFGSKGRSIAEDHSAMMAKRRGGEFRVFAPAFHLPLRDGANTLLPPSKLMSFDKKSRVFVVLGASGGLGTAICQEILRRHRRDNGRVLLVTASRSGPKWSSAGDDSNSNAVVHVALDVENDDSLFGFAERVAEAVSSKPGSSRDSSTSFAAGPPLQRKLVDVVVDAIGYDVRKPLSAHTIEDIDRSIRINQRAPIVLLQQLVPMMRDDGAFIYLGGFVDGSLAFPYYSVDVATRAAMFSFFESCRREFALDGVSVRLLYFCPSAADTDAERPFRDLWKKMGAEYVQPLDVGKAVLDAVGKKGVEFRAMGFGTSTIGCVNRLSPHMADLLYMNGAGKALKKWFG